MSDNPACQFCQKQMVYVPLTLPPKGGPGGRTITIKVYYCYDCKAEHAYFGDILNTHLYTEINNRTYRWSIELNGTMGRLWHVGQPGVPGKSPNRSMQLVKDFGDCYPRITPWNIQEKLRFILLFL